MKINRDRTRRWMLPMLVAMVVAGIFSGYQMSQRDFSSDSDDALAKTRWSSTGWSGKTEGVLHSTAFVPLQTDGVDGISASKTAAVIVLGEKESAGIQRLSTPALEIRQLDSGRLQLSWDLIQDASGYLVELYSDGGKLLESAQVSRFESYYLTQFQVEEDVYYRLRVKALRAETSQKEDSLWDSVVYRAGDWKPEAVKNVQLELVDDEENSKEVRLQASWDTQQDDSAYRVILTDPDGAVLFDETVEGNYTYFDQVTPASTGRYTVKVCRVEQERGMRSDYRWDGLRVENASRKLDSPVIFTEFSDPTLSVRWEPVDHARSYSLRIREYGSDHSILDSGSTTDTEFVFENVDFQKNTKYVVEIRANAQSGYQSSDYTGYSTGYYGWQ